MVALIETDKIGRINPFDRAVKWRPQRTIREGRIKKKIKRNCSEISETVFPRGRARRKGFRTDQDLGAGSSRKKREPSLRTKNGGVLRKRI